MIINQRQSHEKLSRVHLIALTGIWFFMHAVILIRLGVRDHLFDSLLYIKGADFLSENGAFEDGHHFFYAVPIILLALFRKISAEGNLLFVAFQCVLSWSAAIALFFASTKIFKSVSAGFMTGCIFLLWWDVIQWNTVIMTESIACSLICFIIYQLAYFKESTRSYTCLSISLILVFFTRPTGIVVIVGFVVFMLIHFWPSLKQMPILKYCTLGVLILLGYVGAYLMFSRWDFTEQYAEGNIVTYMNTVKGTAHYYPSLRLETENVIMPDASEFPVQKIVTFVWHNPLFFFKSFLLKIFYLIAGVRPYFSFGHNLYTLMWLAAIYLLSAIGFRSLARNNALRFFVLAVILVNCALIGIATVDWDNRFYVPMMPGLAFLASGGLRLVLLRFKNKITPHLPSSK